MQLPEEFGMNGNSAEAALTEYREVPVRLLEGTQRLAEQLHDILGDRLLVTAGCLYLPIVQIKNPTTVQDSGKAEKVVEDYNDLPSTGLRYHSSLDKLELPFSKPGELVAELTVNITTSARYELLSESDFIRDGLAKEAIASDPMRDTKLRLTKEPVPYRLFDATERLLIPHINRDKILCRPTVARLPVK